MTNSTEANFILIVDDELEILGLEEITLRTFYSGEILKASSGNKAKELIQKRGVPEIIISDYRMPDGDGHSLYKFVQEQKMSTPFIVCSANPREDMVRLFPNAYAIVEKPAIISPILNLVKQITRKIGKPGDHVEIPLNMVRPALVLPFDYFLRLSETNIVQIFKSGDPVLESDMIKLKEKGVTSLLISHRDATAFLKLYEEYISHRLTLEADPIQVVNLSFESLTIIEKLAKPLGWTPEFIESAKKSITTAVQALSRDVSIGKVIMQKLSDPGSGYNKHVFLTSLISCTFCNYMGFTTDAAQLKMAMASLLHDIKVGDTCYDDIESWNRYALSKNESDPDVSRYRNHPISGADFIKSLRNLPPDVDQIVLQHHERPDGTGFPKGINHTRIAYVSSIFIMTEDFVGILLKSVNLEEAIERYLLLGDDAYNSGNFKKVFAVVRSKLQAASLNSSAAS